MKSQIVGQEVLAKNIVKFTERFLEEVNKDMHSVRELLYTTVISNISKTDSHEGHPYARGGVNPHNPPYSVHMITGNLVNSVYSFINEARVNDGKLQASAVVGVDGNLDYAKYVLFGTSKMVPRNFLIGSREEIKNEAIEILSRSLKNAVINFDGKKIKL